MQTVVEKIMVIDGEWEREIVPCSEEEMHNFITEEIRPDFKTSYVVAVKFAVSNGSEKEETIWYINPYYTFYDNFDYKLASEIIPEIMYIQPNMVRGDLFQRYDEFYAQLMKDNLSDVSDKEKFDLFLKFLLTNH